VVIWEKHSTKEMDQENQDSQKDNPVGIRVGIGDFGQVPRFHQGQRYAVFTYPSDRRIP
jgi:hypothetical protein